MDAGLKAFLEEQGYEDVREVPGHGVCGVLRFAFTHGICCDMNETTRGYRYCYHTRYEAKKAFADWDGNGHPPGNWIKLKGRGQDITNPEYGEH